MISTKPLSEPMMTKFGATNGIIRPPWVNNVQLTHLVVDKMAAILADGIQMH